MKNKVLSKRLKIPQGFKNVAKPGMPYGSVIKIKPGMRLAVAKGKGKVIADSEREVQKAIRVQRKVLLLKYPTPEGMTRREYNKIHRLPRPFKTKYRSAMPAMTRFWWNEMSKERQKEFRKQFPEPEWRKLFPLTK